MFLTLAIVQVVLAVCAGYDGDMNLANHKATHMWACLIMSKLARND
jgi:hypothetical protein